MLGPKVSAVIRRLKQVGRQVKDNMAAAVTTEVTNSKDQTVKSWDTQDTLSRTCISGNRFTKYMGRLFNASSRVLWVITIF